MYFQFIPINKLFVLSIRLLPGSGRRSGSLSMKASAPAGHDGDKPGGSSRLTVRLDLTRATSASFSREVPVSTDVTPAKLARGSSANSTPTRGQQVTRSVANSTPTRGQQVTRSVTARKGSLALLMTFPIMTPIPR